MPRIVHLNELCDCTLRDSLSAIKQAHVQLHLLTGECTTATVLASQIELCDVLLLEISGIRSNLAKDLRQTRDPLQAGGQLH